MRLFFLSAFVLLSCSIFISCNETEAVFEHPLVEFDNIKGEWKWFPIDNMICRDGSSTGVSVKYGSAEGKWVIYLMGGGACFTPSTCDGNPANYIAEDFFIRQEQGWYDSGILNSEREENPVKDWNFIFVPYCTGDVHSGDNDESYGLGLTEPQKFVGSRNISNLLEWLKPYAEYNGIDEVMLAGISAGGFGTHLALYDLKDKFPDVKMHVINDSGPLFGDPELFPTCLQLGFQFIYDIPLPPGYIICCQPSYGLANIYTYSGRLFPDVNFGLSSYWEDDINRFFYAAGQNSCSGAEIPGSLYRQGLEHLRNNLLIPAGNVSTFFVEGDGHTFIQTDSRFYETTAGGKIYYEWVRDVMNGMVQHLE